MKEFYQDDISHCSTYADYIYQVRPEEKTILLIDDDPDHLMLFGSMIGRQGFQVITLSDASKAMEILSDKQIDLIICDIMMPGINGIEFVKGHTTQEVLEGNKSIPIIMLTSCTEEIEFDALESGADLFCSKYSAHKFLMGQIHYLLQANLA